MERHGKAKKRYKSTKEQNYRYNLKSRYGITPDDYAAILASQDGVCAICGYAPSSDAHSKRLVVDHCHTHIQIRSLLCHHCNTGLGYMKDSVEVLIKAARYLIRHQTIISAKLRKEADDVS